MKLQKLYRYVRQAADEYNLIEDGDKIKIDINNRTIDLLVDEATLQKRKENFKPYVNEVPKGYLSKYQRSVSQANKGAIAQ